jgi:ketosteroid isomerase-like protein
VSKQNVDVVRRAWEAFVRNDDETAYALYDPEVAIESWVDGRVYRGLEGVRQFFGDWLGAWRQWDTDLEELVDAGDDVIALMHIRAKGKHSGVPVEFRQAHVWTLRGGRLARLRVYDTRDEAFDAINPGEREPSDEER